MKIAICLTGMHTWDPANIYDEPCGVSGTDINAIGLAYALARHGHDVDLFGPFTRDLQHESGASLRRYSRYLRHRCDVAIAYHDSSVLRQFTADLKFGHHQTYNLFGLWRPDMADHFISATELNADTNQRKYGGTWHVLPNAWDEGTRPKWKPTPGRLIWNTDPHRGLHHLLRLLPDIRAEVPEVHLDVLGWIPERFDVDRLDAAHAAQARDMHRWLELLGGCVTLHGRKSRNETLEMISRAHCYAYYSAPAVPCEVFPMSVTDCLATGCPVVLKPADGIERIFKDGAWLVDNDDAFVLEVIRVLREEGRAEDLSKQGKRWARGRTFDRQAVQMERLIEKVRKEKAA